MDSLLVAAVQGTGLGIFIWYLIRSLGQKIEGLQNLVSAQKETIEVMERRIAETEKIGGIYKSLLSELPTDIENFKTIISKTKDAVIVELQNQNVETKRKLEEAQNKIQGTTASDEQLSIYFKILKNLLSKPKDSYGQHKELELLKIIEFKSGTLENAIPLIFSIPSLEEFLIKIGYKINLCDDENAINKIFSKGTMPDGRRIGVGFATQSTGINGNGWLAVADDQLWVNETMHNNISDEYSYVKHVV